MGMAREPGAGGKARILITEDDAEFRQTLGDHLRLLGEFEVAEAATGAEALALIGQQPFDILLLDVRLPDMDGRDLCQLVRRRGVTAPVLMLTIAASDADIILGLEAGANDYVTKPCRLGVLLARIRAQLREHRQGRPAAVGIGDFRYDPAGRRLVHRASGRAVELTVKEAATLDCLLRAEGRVVLRETLLRDVFGYGADIDTRTVETHIYRLRQKIEEPGAGRTLLLTEPGGYRLAV